MANTKYKRENLYTVIVIYLDNGRPKGAKYRNVEMDKPAVWERTKAFFMDRFPTATHCNIYGGVSRQFKKREVLRESNK